MNGEVTVKQAMTRLSASRPTVIKLIESGDLKGRKEPHGSRFWWLIVDSSLESYYDQHGPYGGSRHSSRDVRALSQRVAALEQAAELHQRSARTGVTGDLDDARARIVDLEETVARLNAVIELQREADAARSEVTAHLVEALKSGDRADGLRRVISTELDEALRSVLAPGHLADLKDGDPQAPQR